MDQPNGVTDGSGSCGPRPSEETPPDSPPLPLGASSTDPPQNRPRDLRSNFVVRASWVGFGLGAGASVLLGLSELVHASSGCSIFQDVLGGFIIGPYLSWVVVKPLVGRSAALLESFFLPIYRAVVWNPERYRETYGKPLPHSIKLPTQDSGSRESANEETQP